MLTHIYILLLSTQLDVGHIVNMSVKYDRITQMITCTSTGGPATEVSWFKDNEKITVTSSEDLYEYSQIITSTTSATYENRLRIADKSSKATGTYTCEVTNSRGSRNKSLYIQGNHKFAIILILIKVARLLFDQVDLHVKSSQHAHI